MADNSVPSMPLKRDHARVKPDETPSHGGGLSEEARKRLEARRRERNMPSSSSAAVAVKPDRDGDRRSGLGDFQSRANRGSVPDDRRNGRDRDGRGYQNGNRNGNDERRYGGESSRSRDDRGYNASMRVPNQRWDETPRARNGAGRSDDTGRRSWDSTPSARKSDRDGDDIEEQWANGKEWEEEQVRLDRDWYNYDDEGAVVCRTPSELVAIELIMQAGDEEHNPFAQWENLERQKEEEMQAKVQKRQSARQAQYVRQPSTIAPGKISLTI